MAKSPGTSKSRPVSSHEDFDNPRSNLVYLSRGPSFLSSMSTMLPSFPQIPLQSLTHEITCLKQSFELINEGALQDYLRTQLTKHPDGRIKRQQKKMIDNCLDMLGMVPSSKNVKTQDTLAESSKILLTEFRQPLQVQSHLEMPRILVQLGHTQCT